MEKINLLKIISKNILIHNFFYFLNAEELGIGDWANPPSPNPNTQTQPSTIFKIIFKY